MSSLKTHRDSDSPKRKCRPAGPRQSTPARLSSSPPSVSDSALPSTGHGRRGEASPLHRITRSATKGGGRFRTQYVSAGARVRTWDVFWMQHHRRWLQTLKPTRWPLQQQGLDCEKQWRKETSLKSPYILPRIRQAHQSLNYPRS